MDINRLKMVQKKKCNPCNCKLSLLILLFILIYFKCDLCNYKATHQGILNGYKHTETLTEQKM